MILFPIPLIVQLIICVGLAVVAAFIEAARREKRQLGGILGGLLGGNGQQGYGNKNITSSSQLEILTFWFICDQ
jgi:hypothetical protein